MVEKKVADELAQGEFQSIDLSIDETFIPTISYFVSCLKSLLSKKLEEDDIWQPVVWYLRSSSQ